MKYFTLLLLFFLCTCVSAQKELPSTTLGSGSVIVELGEGTWEISISSAFIHEVHKYVSEARFRENPSEFADYEIIKAAGRYDLRMVHKQINQQLEEGWVLQSSKHAMAAAVLEYNHVLRPEILHYAFSVPTPVSKREVKPQGEVVIAVEMADFDAEKFRGGLLKEADSTYTLLIEEKVGEIWLEYYRLNNAGITAGDAPSLVEAIILARGKITFVVQLMTGRYRYDFAYGANNRFYFSGFQLQTDNECGIQELKVKLSTSVLSGRYLPERCSPGDKEQIFRELVRAQRMLLSEFIPGTRRIDLEKPAATVFY